jgi:acyl transferase domain-containing protein
MNDSRRVFLFGPQGGHWSSSIVELYRSDPFFRGKLHECDAEIVKWGGWSLTDELNRNGSAQLGADPARSQATSTGLQIALAALAAARGARASGVAGLSLGELAAAEVAGAISLRDALRIACAQGRLQGAGYPSGKMVHVVLPWRDAERLAAGTGAAAAVELSDTRTVVAGPSPAILAFIALASERGVHTTAVPMAMAYHTSTVTPLRREFGALAAPVKPRRGKVPLYSCVTGRRESGVRLGPSYWWRVLAAPASFARAARHMFADGYREFVEVSAAPMLSQCIAEVAAGEGIAVHIEAVMTTVGSAGPTAARSAR